MTEKNKMHLILEDLHLILENQKRKANLGITGWKWGWRTHPIHHTKSFHNGIDLPAETGMPIYAPYDCTVLRLWKDKLNGNALRLFHLNNNYIIETAYAHMHKMPKYLKYCWKENIVVKAGMVIGYVGSTGGSTGPHLHFITRLAKSYDSIAGRRRDIDPMPFLEDSLE